MAGVIKGTLLFVRFVTPWVFRAAWGIFLMMMGTLVSVIKGMNTTSDDLAWFWTDRAIREGLPNRYDRVTFISVKVLSLIMMVVGWGFLSVLTTWLINRIF